MTRTPLKGPMPGPQPRPGALRCLALVLALSIQFPFSVSAQESAPRRARSPQRATQAEARRLDLAAPVVSEIAAGQTNAHLISLDAGQFARIVVEQQGVNVSLSLRTSAGVVLVSVDDLELLKGLEELMFVAEVSGLYRLEVRAANNADDVETAGRYTIRLAELRAATAPDRERVAAEKFLVEGRSFLSQRTAESRRRAIEKFNDGAMAFRRAGDRGREAQVTNNIGLFYSYLGEKEAALDHYERALSLGREAGDLRSQSRSLHFLGVVHSGMGEAERALDFHRRALEIRRALNDNVLIAISLDHIGMVYAHFGDARRALEYYELALEVPREPGLIQGATKILANIGKAHEALGNLEGALEYQTRALANQRARKIPGAVATILHSIGRVHVKAGDFSKALACFEESLALRRTLGNPNLVAATLTSVGEIHYRLGDSHKALEHFRESLTASRPGGDARGEAVTRYWISRVLSDRGETNDALREIGRSVEIVERLRTRVASDELRASFFATVEQYYELYTELLMRLHAADPAAGHDAAALAVSERARARSLLDLLIEAGADIRRGVDAGLLARERVLQQRLNAAAENYATLGAGRRNEAQAVEVAKEVAALAAEMDELRAEIRRVSPRYSALLEPQTLGLGEIQGLLDAETLVVEYKLGESRSFLWAVTHSEMKSFVLPGRAKIEGVARRLHQQLTERNRRPAGEPPDHRRARLARAESEYADVAQALSRMLLAPAAAMLGRKRLVVVADGALHYVPFAALPAPIGEAKKERQVSPSVPLIVDHEVVNLPSLSVLTVLRKEVAGRRPAPRSVAVLADPVFDPADARVVASTASQRGAHRRGGARAKAASAPATLAQSDFAQAALDSGLTLSGPAIPRLSFSRREASAILASASDGRGTAALDFRASRATAMGAELSQYRHIHFATHGLLNSTRPQLSGLVLSLVDERGRGQDGYLRLHEIYNLHLPAELVVLSACETGLGKEVKGEGLVGLTRGFMYAGSPRVAASLWKVDDAATAELMATFYLGMLKEGLPPSAALRKAQMRMLAQKQWQSPYYWAAFVLQGEWR